MRAKRGAAVGPSPGDRRKTGSEHRLIGFGAWWTYFDFAGGREPLRTPPVTVQWMFAHVPLTAAVAAMGAAMVSLVEHAHADRTDPATAWVLCTGAAVVLLVTMVVAATLQVWRTAKRELFRTLSRVCGAAAAGCLVLGALHPAPLVLGILLVALISIPWCCAVTVRLRHAAVSPQAGAGAGR